MRLHRVRISVRLMMILVFLVALGFSGTRWAMEMKKLSKKWSSLADDYKVSQSVYSDPELEIYDPVVRDRIVRHLGLLNEKYEYAARHPWFKVDPDPPEPIEAQKLGVKLTIDPDVVEAPDPRMGIHPPLGRDH